MELFKTESRTPPLAWRMQPGDFDDFLGQADLLGRNKPLRRLIEEDKIVSLILYGPPGTGKTALAHLIAKKTKAGFISLNAVTAGVRDIREAVSSLRSAKTILFVDEIHRFNKVQQDALLPHIETGELTLVGASTENPFFSLVPALSSRSLIFRLNPIPKDDLKALLARALGDARGLGGSGVSLAEDAADFIASVSEGDARRALNTLELAFLSLGGSGEGKLITLGRVKEAIQNKTLYYDEDDHYDTISAFIKSMRGSDPDATVYWLAKMIESGEDPLFVARRIVICAAEDVGNADPRALGVAVAAMQALERIGMPEGRIPLSQAALYIAAAPKSNASYLAIERAAEALRTEAVQRVPAHLRDAHYKGAKRLGAGEGYVYPHDFPGHYVQQDYLNRKKHFYHPSSEGFERVIKLRLQKRRSTPDE